MKTEIPLNHLSCLSIRAAGCEWGDCHQVTSARLVIVIVIVFVFVIVIVVIIVIIVVFIVVVVIFLLFLCTPLSNDIIVN